MVNPAVKGSEFTPDEADFAKLLLSFGGMLRLPVIHRDQVDLLPLRYVESETVAAFFDTCNLGNLALPEEKWKAFISETREATDKWIKAVGLERSVRTRFSYEKDVDFGDCRRARMVIVARQPCALVVPVLCDSWWDDLKKRMKQHSEKTGVQYVKPIRRRNE